MVIKLQNIKNYLKEPVSIYSLAGFRVLFGFCMLLSTVRFMSLGWIEDHYIEPLMHFKYYGFEWVKSASPFVLYAIHILLFLSSLAVMLGWRYRIGAILQFLCFTYLELIDLTYYLNHYYYVSLVCFLLIFVPANAAFSLDTKQGRQKAFGFVSRWIPGVFMLLIALVYLNAGLNKINEDWLIHALPLKIWLPASYDMPLIGGLFAWKYTPWIFAWAGMLYDCTIFLFLFNRKTRPWAYLSVVFFHAITGFLFQIGVFPLVMMAGTLIFFSAEWHLRWMRFLIPSLQATAATVHRYNNRFVSYLFLAFFTFQFLFPWRFILYSGKFHWNEEAYRFGWRVMLVEKAGTATFYVKDGEEGREGQIDNRDFLNSHQEKQMSYQPDMILQYAHFLAEHFKKEGMIEPQVRAEVYVTFNGRPSKLFIDSSINLAAINDSWEAKSWVLPYPYENSK